MTDRPWRDRDAVEHLYIEEGLSAYDIADRFGCSRTTVEDWLYRHEIKQPEDANDKPWKDPEKLLYLHFTEDLPTDEMADKLGCSENTIRTWMRRHEIRVNWSEDTDPVDPDEKPWTDQNKLRELKVEQGLTNPEIAERLGCSQSTVSRWNRRFGIEKEDEDPKWYDEELLRSLYSEEDLTTYEIADRFGCSNSTISVWLGRFGIDTSDNKAWQEEETLRELYVENNLSTTEIADELGCSHSSVSKWLSKHGIRTGSNEMRDDFSEVQEDDYEPYRDENVLENLYIDKGLSTTEISARFSIAPRTVRKYLHKFDLWDQKEESEPELDWISEQIGQKYPWRDKTTMELLYEKHDLTFAQISDILHCSNGTLSKWMNIHDIDTSPDHVRPSDEQLRRLYKEKGFTGPEIASKFNVHNGTIYNWLEDAGIERGQKSNPVPEAIRNEDRLRDLYVEREWTIQEIVDRYNVAKNTVQYWMDQHDIEIRSTAEQISGEKHPYWKGGESEYGPGWTAKKKVQVIERDDEKCQSCGIDRDKYRAEFGRDLDVHHIIPARDFEDPEKRNDPDNLVTLCRKCHHKWEGIPIRPSLKESYAG